MTTTDDVVQYDQRRLLKLLWRHTGLVLVLVLLGLAAGVAVALVRGPQFTAESQVQVGEPASLRTLLVESPTARDQERLVDSQVRRLQSDRVARQVEEDLGPGRPEHSVAFSSSSDTNVVGITVTSSQAATARDAANAYSEVYLEQLAADGEALIAQTQEQLTARVEALSGQIEVLEETISGASEESLPQVSAVIEPQRDELIGRRGVLERQLDQLQLVQSVDTSGGARSISTATTATRSLVDRVSPVLLGALLGLLAGVAAVAVREALAGRVVDEDDVAASGLAPRATTSLPVRLPAAPRPVAEETLPPAEEAPYRGLAAALWPPHATAQGGVSLMAAAGSRPDGTGLLVARVARQLARMGRSVAVVEGDFSARELDEVLLLGDRPGTADVLRGEVGLDQALVRQEDGLLVLGAGRGADPASLGTPAYARLLREVADRVDVVLLTGAPLGGSVDSLVVAPLADRLVVLARRGRTRRHELESLRRAVATHPTDAHALAHPDVVIHGRSRRGGRRRAVAEPARPAAAVRADRPRTDAGAVPRPGGSVGATAGVGGARASD